jgi:hypothetical protein
LKLDLRGIVVVVGNYGSGKSEVSVNLAIHHQNGGKDVHIADLDLVNPYFRTREAKVMLSAMGIHVVVPPKIYLQADLPILSPAVGGLIQRPVRLAIFDVGGDDTGATVLSALKGFFDNKSVQMLMVVNPYRPQTDTIAGCLGIRDEIEHASRMQINGIIGNANLIDETKPDDIYTGYDFAHNLSEKSGLALKFITTPVSLLNRIELHRFKCPVLPIKRRFVPPWKKADFDDIIRSQFKNVLPS